MAQTGHTTSGVRRPPLLWLLGGLALAAVTVVVVLLTAGSSDDPKLTVTDGVAAAGFPLRGDLARDTATIRAAADAWLAHDAGEDGDSRVLDHDEVEMRALWAGRFGDSKAVILAERRHAALVELDADDTFRVQGVQEIRDDEDPGLVAFDQAVLVDTKADPAFMPADVRAGDVAPRDGLWTPAGPEAASSLPDGTLVLRGGMPRSSRGERTAPAAVVLSNPSSTWLIDAALMAKLVPGTQTFSPAAYQRLVAATKPPGAEDENAQWNRNFDPPELRLVQDRTLPVLGPTMVLTVAGDPPSGRDRVLVAHGGSQVAGEDEAEMLVLDDGRNDDDNAAYDEDGPALAAAIVGGGTPRRPSRGLSVFVAGSSQIESIEVLTGRARLTRRGPVAVVPLPESTDDGRGETRPRDDLAVLGRTRSGTVVVPSRIHDG